ncbi:MAG: type II toxin-antitoxin system PemK/MazF family toxin [Candidatus Aminicenantes bacterium]|nr:type II toxin-antitoxin system PemK/MazF family toxin [Candidatus Aminicenantes bacterium]NIM79331.1 type II toxin-antitoxin system PemK/MazF family toxin [Candidatus Aminicenantes bacterium]NIN18608.1 type II toxin-antitoxin system PemK/MazF family toxin [Candidatus Aminicenantes bacterium]NIN42497.1 type II toxin-antitoxin system PemK/MazF family toxin [Candidatus Aminicenantes bacterium]NIN85263.1 type II toxin-antitoxin system PemK/MazF family toxin [Candidatus Aminicenantes bacterium]
MENLSTTKNKIVLIPFPFDTLETTKVRPALCLTDPIGPHRHVILAFMSSRIPDNLLESDLLIDSSEEDFGTTGLRVSSTLRLHRLMTVATSLIRRELGVLSPAMQKKVLSKLKKVFGLPSGGEQTKEVTKDPDKKLTKDEHHETKAQENEKSEGISEE